MYDIRRSHQFKKSYKRISKSGIFEQEIFDIVTSFLVIGKELPKQYYDHALKGDSLGLRECHISGDCLLIYEINHDEKFVRFMNIGNHANLFE